jgi:trk system potassium uptake protein TrkA
VYIIIAGAGVVGFHIAYLLAQEHHEVTVIERSGEAIDNVRRQMEVGTVVGNATLPNTLKEAEAHRADLLVAATDSDETNIVICFTAKQLGTRMTVARVRNPEYSSGYFIGSGTPSSPSRKIIRPKTFGVDLFINPVTEAAEEISDIISSFYSAPVKNFANGLIQIREFRAENEAVVDKPLSEVAFPKPCRVVAILRAEGVFIPATDEVFKEGDHVYLITAKEFGDKLGMMFAQPKPPARNVVILGGGRVGFMIAERLKANRVSIKIIEKSIDRCQEIAIALGETATVVQGDGTDRDFLIEQGVPLADAFVCATESDETNILSGLLAKSLGIPRNLILVNKPGNISLAEAVGVDVAASPLLLTARKIAHFTLHGGAIAVALIGGEQIQAIEFMTSPTAQIIGHTIKEIGFPKGAIAGAIMRNNTVIIPPDDTTIQPGDHVIIVSPPAVTPAVEKLFM